MRPLARHMRAYVLPFVHTPLAVGETNRYERVYHLLFAGSVFGPLLQAVDVGNDEEKSPDLLKSLSARTRSSRDVSSRSTSRLFFSGTCHTRVGSYSHSVADPFLPCCTSSRSRRRPQSRRQPIRLRALPLTLTPPQPRSRGSQERCQFTLQTCVFVQCAGILR